MHLYQSNRLENLLAAQILAIGDSTLAQKISDFRAKQTQKILDNPTPGVIG